MKQAHQNPHEGIRIGLSFDRAIQRALNTPPMKDDPRPSRLTLQQTSRKRTLRKAAKPAR